MNVKSPPPIFKLKRILLIWIIIQALGSCLMPQPRFTLKKNLFLEMIKKEIINVEFIYIEEYN